MLLEILRTVLGRQLLGQVRKTGLQVVVVIGLICMLHIFLQPS